jgi:hypothetical protein
MASGESGRRFLLQHSQLGRNSSMGISPTEIRNPTRGAVSDVLVNPSKDGGVSPRFLRHSGLADTAHRTV